MEAIYQKARELADLIYQSDAYRAVRTAEAKVEKDDGLKKLVDQHNKLAEKIGQKEKKLEPIEPEEKRELIRMREEMQANESLQELLRSRTEYAMIMNKITAILRDKLDRRDEAKKNEE